MTLVACTNVATSQAKITSSSSDSNVRVGSFSFSVIVKAPSLSDRFSTYYYFLAVNQIICTADGYKNLNSRLKLFLSF